MLKWIDLQRLALILLISITAPTLVAPGALAQDSEWNQAIALNNRGVDLAKSGQYIEAIEALKQAIRLQSNFPSAYYNLGCVYAGLVRSEEAIAAFQQALRLKPDYARSA